MVSIEFILDVLRVSLYSMLTVLLLIWRISLLVKIKTWCVMSAQTEELHEVEVTDNDGKVVRVSCSQHVIDLLMSTSTGSDVKQMICDSLLQNKPSQESKSCIASGDTSRDNASKWNPQSEKLVLEKFSDLERGQSKRHKWKVMAEEMNKLGYNFTSEQCRLKIKSLKEKYDRNKNKQKKSGESPPDSDCEELQEIFDKCPDMKPKYIIDTGDKASDNSPLCSSPKESPTPTPEPSKGKKRPAETSSPPLCSSDDETSSQRKRPKRSVDVMKAFLGDVLRKREEAVERRHQENLQAVNALVDVLKESIKKD